MKSKKIFALLLSALMVLAVLPMGTFAATSDPTTSGGERCPNCGEYGYHASFDQGGGPTCTEPGENYLGWCEICRESNYETIPPLGHDWASGDSRELRQPTCTEPGSQERYCGRCGEMEVADIPPLGHDWDDPYKVKDPTCTEAGYNDHECLRCHTVDFCNDIPALGHDWGPWVVVREASSTQKGQEKSECRRCDAERFREFDYVGPTVEDVEVGKMEPSPPANGQYYVEGEELEYVVWIEDTKSRRCIENIHLTDPLGGYDDTYINNGGPTSMWSSRAYIHTVTAEDVERGYVENTAEFSWNFVGETERHSATTNTVIVPTGREARDDGGLHVIDTSDWGEAVNRCTLSIEKRVLSSPANGQYYVAGELIHYYVAVTVPQDIGLSEAYILDDLIASVPIYDCTTAGGSTKQGVEFGYVVTDLDVAQGYVENYAMLVWTDANGRRSQTSSNVVTVPTGEGTAVGSPTIKKVCTSTPANGQYYTEGEYVEFAVTITNPANGRELTDIIIWDAWENSEAVIYNEARHDAIQPGESFTAYFGGTVTEFDVAKGSIDNMAGADYWAPEYTRMKIVYCSVPTGEGSAEYSAFIGKTCMSYPANGMYFAVGEEIVYRVDYQNTGAKTLYDVRIYDEGVIVDTMSRLDPGQFTAAYYTKVVSENDAINGYKNNVAYFSGCDENGAYHGAESNMVTVPAGYAPFGVITEMTIEKAEVSTPANGTHYTEGETIEYAITLTNSGETMFTDCFVYDVLAGYSKMEIGYAEMLNPGEIRTYTVKYKVTAADVATGYVANSATTSGTVADGFTYTATSNIVISDTDGNPDDVPQAPGPWIPGGNNPGGKLTGMIKLKGEKDDGRQCITRIIKYSDGSWEYNTDFCTLHDKTRQEVEKLVASAKDDAAMLKQLAKAKKLWTDHIEDMYKALYDHADTLGKMTIMEEQVSFFDLIANKELMLTALNPEEPVLVAQNIVDTLEERCNKLCYDIHNCPNERADRLTDLVEEIMLPHGEDCLTKLKLEEDRTVTEKLSLCANHKILDDQVQVLLASELPEFAWIGAYKLWVVELQKSFNKLSAAYPKDVAAFIGAYYRSLMVQVQAHEKLLNLFYGENPAVTGEVMSSIIRDYILETCPITPDVSQVTSISKGFSRAPMGKKKG